MDLSDFLHEGRGQYYKKTDEARFSKKKFNPRLEGINCQKMMIFGFYSKTALTILIIFYMLVGIDETYYMNHISSLGKFTKGD